MAERSCRATTSPSAACWSMTFPGWSESDERLRSGSIYIVGPQKHRSPADLGKFGRPKNVRRSFNRPKTVYFGFLRLPGVNIRLHSATLAQRTAEERRTSAAERPKASSLEPGSPIFGSLCLSRPNNARRSLTCAREAGLYRAFAVYLRVLARTFAYLRPGNVSIAR